MPIKKNSGATVHLRGFKRKTRCLQSHCESAEDVCVCARSHTHTHTFSVSSVNRRLPASSSGRGSAVSTAAASEL